MTLLRREPVLILWPSNLDDATLGEQLGRLSRFRHLADIVPALRMLGSPFEYGKHLFIEQLFGFGQPFHAINVSKDMTSPAISRTVAARSASLVTSVKPREIAVTPINASCGLLLLAPFLSFNAASSG